MLDRISETLVREPKFIETHLPSPITEFALALASKRGDSYWASGTAVVVAPHLAITAKHVVEDHWTRNEGPWPESGDVVGELSILAFQVPPDGDACLWAVHRIWNSPHTDISFLKLVPASAPAASYRWRHLTINALPPAPGSQITAFGYHASTIAAGAPVDWRHEASNSFGCVVEVHEERRDSVLRNYPCFATDARFDGGMSGGPVFNEAGELCGLVCSGIAPFDESERHTSYVTTLWPILGTSIDLNRRGFPPGETYPALELARGNQMVVRNWERVHVEIRPDGSSSVGLRGDSAPHAV